MHRFRAMTHARPRILVAGTPDAIETVDVLVGGDVRVIPVASIDDARRHLNRGVDLVICNLRFDESRVFEFLQAVNSLPAARRPPVVCCRMRPLSPRVRHAVELALEAMGGVDFFDLDRMRRQHGIERAHEMFRAALLSHLPVRVDPPA